MKRRRKSGDLPLAFHSLFEQMEDPSRQFIARVTWASLTDAEKSEYEAIVDFKKRMYDRAVELGPTVWKNWDFVKDVFKWTLVEPSHESDVYAALLVKGKMSAIGRSVLRRAESYKLAASHRMMKLAPDKQDKVLLHELVHIGYGGHGADFRRVCQEVGGIISGSGVEEPGVHLEQKQGPRYVRVKTFQTEQEAKLWFLGWKADRTAEATARGEKADFGKWRVSFG